MQGENTFKTTDTSYRTMIGNTGAHDNGVNYTIQGDGSLSVIAEGAKGETYPYGFAGDSLSMESGTIDCNTDFCIVNYAVNISGGSLTVDNYDADLGVGIYTSEGPVNISGGEIDIKAGYKGIDIPQQNYGEEVDGDREINITGGNLKVDSPTVGLYAKNIVINSTGDVSINGTEAAINCCEKGGGISLLAARSLTLTGKNALLPAVTGGGMFITIAGADYTAVDAAIASIPTDLSVYTDETAKAVTDAKNAVVRGKNITEQETVTGYATAIENAVKALVKKPSVPSGDMITILETENGSATYTITQVDGKDVVNINATPAEGYKLSHILVNGSKIEGTTFYKPDFEVKVQVVFTKIATTPTTAPTAAPTDKSNNSPQTGDSLPIIPIVIVAVALCGAVVLLAVKKKSTKI